jgi:hypothetical protein
MASETLEIQNLLQQTQQMAQMAKAHGLPPSV